MFARILIMSGNSPWWTFWKCINGSLPQRNAVLSRFESDCRSLSQTQFPGVGRFLWSSVNSHTFCSILSTLWPECPGLKLPICSLYRAIYLRWPLPCEHQVRAAFLRKCWNLGKFKNLLTPSSSGFFPEPYLSWNLAVNTQSLFFHPWGTKVFQGFMLVFFHCGKDTKIRENSLQQRQRL